MANTEKFHTSCMKSLSIIILFCLFCFLVACYGPYSTTDSPGDYNSFEDLTKKTAAEITHENNWTIVSMTENGDRVYWFLAPEIEKASPAMFKKVIHTDKNKEKTEIVSECKAPKQTCDDLMKQFNTLSEKYK
jgi:hypothetical protein